MINKFPIHDIPEGLQWYTLIVFSENIPGTLNQVTTVFTRLQLNIESLNVSASGIENIHRYTITLRSDEAMMKRVVRQIEKKIDVIQARFYAENEIYVMEEALFKISSDALVKNHGITKAIRKLDGRIVEVNPTYAIISKEGLPADVRELYNYFRVSNCLLQYVNSGIVAVTESIVEEFNEHLAMRKRNEEETN